MKNSYPAPDDKILCFLEVLFWNTGIFSYSYGKYWNPREMYKGESGNSP